MANFDQIEEARRLLGLGEAATLKQTKAAYKRAANRYHPDRCQGGDKAKCDEMMKKINEAYELIMEYCAHYSYSFGKEDVTRTYPHDEYLRKYGYGWFDGT